ncbi:MAG: 50S ribosomal protein L4 [Patescibacteria group bacterium]
MEQPLYNQLGENIGTVALSEKLFGVRWNPDMVHEVVRLLMTSRRRSTAHVKDRGDVSGGGKKPWRQKGTGRARHGSTRSPLWVGGGVTHGPNKAKNYVRKINIATRRRALAVVLSKKLKDGEIFFVDQISMSEPKTKIAAETIKKFAGAVGASNFANRGGRTLILLEKSAPETIRAFRNLPYVTIEESRNVNVEKALIPKYLVLTKESLSHIKV